MRESTPCDDVPALVLREESDELVRVLREGQLLLLKYPVAAQAAYRALVAEGRRFATTPDGRRWKERLAGSELVRRGAMLWSGSALDMLEDDPDAVLPSGYLDALFGALAVEDVQALLLRLLDANHA